MRSNAVLPALRLSWRAYATHTGSTNSAGSSLSLASLAAAFRSLGSADASTPQATSKSDTNSNNSSSNSSVVGDARQHSAQHISVTPIAQTPSPSPPSSLAREPLGRQARTHRPKRHEAAASRSPSPPSHRQPRQQQPPSPPPLAALSSAYAEHLQQFEDPQLCAEVEAQLGKRRYGQMLLCLHAVVLRQQRHHVDATQGYDGHPGQRDSRVKKQADKHLEHRMLTAVLRMVTLLDFHAVEDALAAWLRAASIRRGQPTAITPLQQPFSHLVATCLLEWLASEVSCMNAHTSLQVLHLLGHQSLCHNDSILATLVDTIEVHLTQAAKGDDEAKAIDETTNSRSGFTLDEFSLLLDTMVRYQTHVTQAAHVQQHSPASAMVQMAGGDAREAGGTAAALRRRVLHDQRHPVANARLFHCVAEALTRDLLGPTSPSSPPLSTSTSQQPLLRLSTATFFFFTRALTKLQWWSDGLIAVLTPSLTAYLQQHAEAFMGVAMLVGREENTQGDAALLHVLQRSLVLLLERRGHSFSAAPSEEAVDPERGRTETHASPLQPASSSAFEAWSGAAMDGADNDRELEEADEDEDPEGMLLSGLAPAPLSAASHVSPLPLSATPPLKAETVSTSAKAAGELLSFVDLRGLPRLLEALTLFHQRTVAVMPADAPQRAALQREMRHLFTLLENDVQRSYASLETLAARVPPAQLARLILTLLRTEAALQQLEESNTRQPVHSSLLVDLTYVWTRQVSRVRPPPLPPRHTDHQNARAAAHYHRIAASAPWRRAVRVHHALVQHGLLHRTRADRITSSSSSSEFTRGRDDGVGGADACKPGRFFMPDAILALSPAVTAAVDARKRELHVERQRQLAHLLENVDDGNDESRPDARQRPAPAGGSATPRFASAAIRAAAASSGASAEGAPMSHFPPRSAPSSSHATRRAAAVLRRPVRSSDVFAGYSKALSRLL